MAENEMADVTTQDVLAPTQVPLLAYTWWNPPAFSHRSAAGTRSGKNFWKQLHTMLHLTERIVC